MLSIAAALKHSDKLATLSDSARLDVEVLLAKVLQKDRTYLYTWPERELSTAQESLFKQYIEQRQQGCPVAYIIGERDFWTLTLSVNSSTLIPRPDTELVVETALELYAADDISKVRRVVDLGTGTGAIALALATEKPAWDITALDCVAEACDLAEHNRQKYQLNNVVVYQGDWLSSMAPLSVDLVVSNPPYIEENDPHINQGDVRFEPHSALIAENKGLADIDIIAEQSTHVLLPQGWLVVEHGFQQSEAVLTILQEKGFSHCESRHDLSGHLRLTLGQWS